MTYVFQPGERVSISASALAWRKLPADYGAGSVVAFLPGTGLAGADGVRLDRVRVKLDRLPKDFIFSARDVNTA